MKKQKEDHSEKVWVYVAGCPPLHSSLPAMLRIALQAGHEGINSGRLGRPCKTLGRDACPALAKRFAWLRGASPYLRMQNGRANCPSEPRREEINYTFKERTQKEETQNLRKSNGSVLIIVLWVIGLLSMFVMAFAFDMHIEARIVSTWRKKLKAEYLAKAGIELSRMALLETADPQVTNPEVSGYISEGSDSARRAATVSLARGGGAELSRELGEGTVTVRIRPENARINLNSIINVNNREETYGLWEPIFETAGVPFDQRDTLIDCLVDWVDQDELTHLNGVESEYYQKLTPPYQSKNALLDTVDELALIKGFNEFIPNTTQTVYEAVAHFLTTYAEDRTININAVDHNTLMAFLGLDSQMAEEIISQRNGPDGEPGTEDDTPFKDLQDLLTRVPFLNQSIAPYISFTAKGRFYILSSGKVGDVERVCACVVLLAENKLTFLSWIEGDSASIDLITR